MATAQPGLARPGLMEPGTADMVSLSLVLPGQRRRPVLLRRRRSAQPVPTQIAAPTNPVFIPARTGHQAKALLRRGESAAAPSRQAAPPEMDRPNRRSIPRIRGRSAQTVPPQFNPPVVLQPLAHRIRTALRRGHAAQPVPTVATPVAPPFVPAGLAHRLRLGIRRQRPTDVPVVAQPPISGPTVRIRQARLRRGATAFPVPTQQAAPTSPAWVPSLIHKIRPALRRGGGRSASPIPAQQSVTTNPAFVFVNLRRVRSLLVRHSKTAAPTPAREYPQVPNHAGVAPSLQVRRGRTAQPPIFQAQPPTSPAVRNRQLRRFLVWLRHGKDARRELGQAVGVVVTYGTGNAGQTVAADAMAGLASAGTGGGGHGNAATGRPGRG